METNLPFLLSNILPTIDMESRDSFFIEDISGNVGCWWHGSPLASYDKLNELFWKRMERVS